MKTLHKFLLIVLFTFLQNVNIYSQIGGVINESRITDWENSGLPFEIPQHLLENGEDINDFFDPASDGDFYNNAFQRILDSFVGGSKYLIYFPEGEYHFNKSIKIPFGVVLKGDGSDKSKLFLVLIFKARRFRMFLLKSRLMPETMKLLLTERKTFLRREL